MAWGPKSKKRRAREAKYVAGFNAESMEIGRGALTFGGAVVVRGSMWLPGICVLIGQKREWMLCRGGALTMPIATMDELVQAVHAGCTPHQQIPAFAVFECHNGQHTLETVESWSTP